MFSGKVTKVALARNFSPMSTSPIEIEIHVRTGFNARDVTAIADLDDVSRAWKFLEH